MEKKVIEKLARQAQNLAETFCDKNREYYTEPFRVFKVVPTSGDCAVVFFEKGESRLLSMTIAFYNPRQKKNDGWKFHFPTDGHLLGIQSMTRWKEWLERENFKRNHSGGGE